jgi:uroporphyrinogen decarboxylase
MTKRERVTAALSRKPVDRPPVSFWRHVPAVDHVAAGLAEAMLAFQRRWDLDFIKVMSSGVYCVEDWGCRVEYAGSPDGAKQCTQHAVESTADWARIKPLDPGAGALGRELEAVRLIARGRPDDAPVLHTIFSPLTIAQKLAGNQLAVDLRTRPEAVLAALEAITETVSRYTGAAFEAGADGLFFATRSATREHTSEEQFRRFEAPYMRRVLAAAADRSRFTLLHVHGTEIYFDEVTALPVHAVNWHDRLTPPSLAEARRRFPGVLAGGLNESETLLRGPEAAVEREVQDAIRQTDSLGLMVTPGCVLPLDVPDEHLEAVVAAVASSRR